MLNIVLEFTDVGRTVWIDFFAMFVANTIIEVPNQLRAFMS
jgi:hypothetical protein